MSRYYYHKGHLRETRPAFETSGDIPDIGVRTLAKNIKRLLSVLTSEELERYRANVRKKQDKGRPKK